MGTHQEQPARGLLSALQDSNVLNPLDAVTETQAYRSARLARLGP